MQAALQRAIFSANLLGDLLYRFRAGVIAHEQLPRLVG